MGSGPTLVLTTSILTVAALTLSGCSDDSPPVDDLGVVEVEELDLPQGDAFLSPDGERIATYASDELCIYSAEGDEERCLGEELSLDAASIRWSPDSSQLVYTENFYKYFLEPDVWVLDAESGEPTNLTDDGVAADDMDIAETAETEETDGPDLDGSPTWVDDDTIRFLRWHRSDDAVAIMEVTDDGGDPEQIGELATDTPPTLISYTADDRVAYARITEQDVVTAGLDGEDVETVFDAGLAVPEVSSDGDEVLVATYPMSYALDEMPPSEIVTSDGEEVGSIDGQLRWAAWRTDGDGLAYAELDEENPEEVIVRLAEDATADGREVESGEYAAPYRMATGRAPVWSTQDTMLLIDMSEADSDELRYVLMHFGEE